MQIRLNITSSGKNWVMAHINQANFTVIGKNNQEIWIQASYNPIFDDEDNVVKVVKYASDITNQKEKAADSNGLVSAIKRSAAVIEFDLDGNILVANDIFLETMGYTLQEIQGNHHSMFATPEYANSPEYKRFWADLKQGEFQAGEFSRVDKYGNTIWLQATYNPTFDALGRPAKVVKYATNITERVKALDSALQTTKNLSGGNLCARMEGEYTGPFEILKNGLNTSIKNIRNTIAQIQNACKQLKINVEAIASDNSQLDKRVVEQSSALQSTVSAMEQMTAATSASADNASRAKSHAEEALSVCKARR